MKRHFNCKYNIEEEQHIIECYNTYKTLNGTARELKCNPDTIRKILRRNGIKWKGVGIAQIGLYKNTEEKFWKRLDKKSNGCWEWTKAHNKDGYGQTCYKGKMVWTHRMAWIYSKGEIPEGMHVLHKCDNPACCNPDHLFLGTHKDNMNDRDKKNRCNNKGLKGELNPQSRYTEKDILQMREMYKKGMKQKEIALIFNTTQPIISNIINRKYWKHI